MITLDQADRLIRSRVPVIVQHEERFEQFRCTMVGRIGKTAIINGGYRLYLPDYNIVNIRLQKRA
jgi:hypothetical protein